MFPNQSANYYHHKDTFHPSTTLLDVLEPPKGNVNNERLNTTVFHSDAQKKSQHTEREKDLIDLMDEFCITTEKQCFPKVDKEKQINDYQIKMLEEFFSTAGNTNKQKTGIYTPDQELQFQKFFDKYEANQKSNVNNKCEEMAKEQACASNYCMNYNIGTPKVLVPKIEKVCTRDDENVNEDLIDEVFVQKTLEKRLMQNPNHQHFINYEKKIERLGQFPKSSHADKNSNLEKSDIMNEILKTNNINCAAVEPKKMHEQAFHRPAPKKISYAEAIDLNNHVIVFDKEENLKSYTRTKINDLVSKQNIKYLEAFKMDEKLFQKRSQLKNDIEKSILTPGPTLYEKSVVLPQIMQRWMERQKANEEVANMKRKLVLDVGAANTLTSATNANTSKFYQSSPTDYATSKSVQIPAVYATTSTSYKTPVAHASTSIQAPAYLSTPTSHFASVEKPESKLNFRYPPIEELRAIRREQVSFGAANPQILIAPQVLKENCNKDRYVAYASSVLLDDFIHGK